MVGTTQRRLTWSCIVLVTTLVPAAVPAADSVHGEQIARRWCASCHVVATNQQTATSEAPPFSTIARKPDFDSGRLAFFLLDPHPKMPDMSLTRAEANDLAAYIATLK